jgi:hypothetical protein
MSALIKIHCGNASSNGCVVTPSRHCRVVPSGWSKKRLSLMRDFLSVATSRRWDGMVGGREAANKPCGLCFPCPDYVPVYIVSGGYLRYVTSTESVGRGSAQKHWDPAVSRVCTLCHLSECTSSPSTQWRSFLSSWMIKTPGCIWRRPRDPGASVNLCASIFISIAYHINVSRPAVGNSTRCGTYAQTRRRSREP